MDDAATIQVGKKGGQFLFFLFPPFFLIHESVGVLKGSLSSPHRLFSRLLLNSLIMSERKSRRTSINSVLGAELFNRVATTLSITDESKYTNVIISA